MTIFSILLLTSRLVPYSFFTDEESGGVSRPNDYRNKVFIQVKDRLDEFVEMIRAYSASGTYFVRKISAQAMLPLLKFTDFIPEIVSTLKSLQDSGNSVK